MKNFELKEWFSKLETDYDILEKEKFSIHTELQELKDQCKKEKEDHTQEITDLNDQADI
eukprot:CAMPEP_0205807768 /NCGR_PEP_ID=MMETSP0205-20121125/11533_1 /ASSEMBLY_ACC=CAM_ASM_000278 /TAXON_ID=36767 /ORGANISM="Euplotes focardii, Strain TN1" /LENGTH=58 /DNA_ID=CAMNT_0053082399 /DNA_START=410 /DNA_END=586 /DNA_ORIENTATION=-